MTPSCELVRNRKIRPTAMGVMNIGDKSVDRKKPRRECQLVVQQLCQEEAQDHFQADRHEHE